MWVVLDERFAKIGPMDAGADAFETRIVHLRRGGFWPWLQIVTSLVKAIRRFRSGDRVLIAAVSPGVRLIVASTALLRGSIYSLLVEENYARSLAVSKGSRRMSTANFLFAFSNRWLFKHAARMIVTDSSTSELIRVEAAGFDVPVVFVPTPFPNSAQPSGPTDRIYRAIA